MPYRTRREYQKIERIRKVKRGLALVVLIGVVLYIVAIAIQLIWHSLI